MKLPEIKTSTLDHPKYMIVYAQPKVGKTTALSHLQNACIVDWENGTKYIKGVAVFNVIDEAKEFKGNPVQTINAFAQMLEDYKTKSGKYPYDYLVIDSLTKIGEVAAKLATVLYKNSVIGKSFTGTDVVSELPNGGGYEWLRQAYKILIDPLVDKSNKCTILVAHTKIASIQKDGKEMSVNDITVTGKYKLALAADVDSIGLMYRDPKNSNILYLSFKSDPSEIICGSRVEKLRDQVIPILTLDGKTFKSNWNEVF